MEVLCVKEGLQLQVHVLDLMEEAGNVGPLSLQSLIALERVSKAWAQE